MMSHIAVACIVPHMWRVGVTCVLAGVLSLAAGPAVAGGPSPLGIATSGNEVLSSKLTVPPDTTVYWENRGTFHNVRFEDGAFEEPADPEATPWRVWRHFDVPGTYRYYCEMHGGPGGQGMSGVVVVEAGADPRLSALSVAPRHVCRHRTPRCRQGGGAVRLTLSGGARVSGGGGPGRESPPPPP